MDFFFYRNLAEKITIYVGSLILIFGLIGNALNLLVFISLKTFRQSSCAFYLTVASVGNVVYLVSALFSRILITGFNIDLTGSSSAICKIRQYVAVVSPLMVVSSMCFATIDQYFSSRNRHTVFNRRRFSVKLILATFIFWSLVNLPVIIFHRTVFSASTGKSTCQIVNEIYEIYFTRFYVSILLGFLPIVVRFVFGCAAFINVRRWSRNRLPIIRLKHERQIATMVLIEIFVEIFLSLPFFVYFTFTSFHPVDPASESFGPYILLILSTNMAFYGCFAVGFYIYFCVSCRFRRQLFYVLCGFQRKYWRRNRVATIDIVFLR